MAEGDSADFEVKDEELVDFEGSDYGFGSDEELDIEESAKQAGDGGPLAHSQEAGPVDPPTPYGAAAASIAPKEGAESGEIEEEKEDKEDGVVMQPAKSAAARGEGGSHGGRRVGESRHRKHRKADLEDGELDDAAMHEASDREAEGNPDEDEEDSVSRQERKRRKDRFAPERQVLDGDRKEKREGDQVLGSTAKHSRSRGSDRHPDRSRSLSKTVPGGRATGNETGGLVPPNNQAGIMGPGRLFVPAELASQIQLRPLGRGFVGPVGGLYSPANGRPNLHMQEALAQEQLFRSQRIMQLAHANANGPGRPPLAGHIGGPPIHPMPTLEFGPVPHGLLHWQTQGPELMQQINLMAPVDTYGRNPRPFVTGRGPMGGIYGLMAGSPGRNMGRQLSWSAVPMANEGQGVGRGRGQGRGQMLAPVWGEPHPGAMVGQALVGVVNVGQGMGLGQGMVSVGMGPGGRPIGPTLAGQGTSQGLLPGLGQGMGHVPEQDAKESCPHNGGQGDVGQTAGRAGQAAQAGHGSASGASNRSNRSSSHSSASGVSTSKREGNFDPKKGENSQSNNDRRSEEDRGSRRGPGHKSDSVRSHNRQYRENGREKRQSVSMSASTALTGALSTLPKSFIHLGGPVHKSRVLTVSGLPDNTSMTAIVQAFEKQGKITDFKKEEKGDTFTITFASLSEAISAKRHLHRSVMDGRQITVEYAVRV